MGRGRVARRRLRISGRIATRSGEGCASVGGATSSSYKLAAGDVGHTMRVVVTATNAGGSTPASSAATGVVAAAPPAAPVNTVLPSVEWFCG